MGKITQQFENHFTDQETEELTKGSTSFFRLDFNQKSEKQWRSSQTTKHMDLTKWHQKTWKSPNQKLSQKTLNEMLRERDEKLTNGYMLANLKPGKNGTGQDGYIPVNLLSNYRKLSSLIILKSTIPKIEALMLPSQYAYRTGKSAGDIVLAHKYLLAISSTKMIKKVFAGVDMSKAFDTVDRKQFKDIQKKRNRGRKLHHHKCEIDLTM